MTEAENDRQNAPASGKVKQLGDFELKRRLGKGGMGEVYLARQVSLDRLVALKTLSRDLSKREDFVHRFLREAKAMAKLDHNNVVRVYAVDSYRGIHFAAIEFVDGRSVRDWMESLGRLDTADAVHIAIMCAEGLKHAHDKNMIHRDIKPDNILITSKGVVKVADFGLAKAADDDVSMTQSGTGLGTPLYMAPEQARNAKHVDQRSDIYALGATLYHMLTGSLPFHGETTLELILSKEKGTYPSARSLRPEIPEKLDLIIDRMMAREPAHRYKSCDAVIRDLSSLGIHSASLSFIEGAEPVAMSRTAGSGLARTMPGGLTATSSNIKASDTGSATVVSGTAATATAALKSSGMMQMTSRVWFLQYEDSAGKTVVEKHSTGRILKMINAGILTAKARGKASADGAYMPLAQFPEFTEAIENQLAHRAAAVRKEDMSSLYAKVAKAEANRHKWRGAKNAVRGLVGWTSLILWIALIIGVAVTGLYFGKKYMQKAVAGLGLTEDATNTPDPNTPTGPAVPQSPTGPKP